MSKSISKEKKNSSDVRFSTLGIINGCVDELIEQRLKPRFAYENTYGIRAINATVYEQAIGYFFQKDGCKDQIQACRTAASVGDQAQYGANVNINKLCADAQDYCLNNVEGAFYNFSNLSPYDIAASITDTFPSPTYAGFLNQKWVQDALGTPVNWTSLYGVNAAFSATGDFPRSGYLNDIAWLLDQGTAVHLVYGKSPRAADDLR